MTYFLRMLVYVLGGGALLAWLQPSHGLVEGLAIVALIGVCAAVDSLVAGAALRQTKHAVRGRKAAPGQRRTAPSGPSSGWGQARNPAEKRTLRLLFTTSSLEEAEALIAELRERKLHPMLATQRGGANEAAIGYEVRLPEVEWQRGHPVMARFPPRMAKS